MVKSKKIKKGSIKILSEIKSLLKNPSDHYSIEMNNDNIYKCNFILFGPEDTIFEGGIFKGELLFPKEYPYKPPSCRFLEQKGMDRDGNCIIVPIIWHPNIYKDGRVCISILHEGEDSYNYESNIERWLPIHGINSIMMSIILMLSEPNPDSAANVDANRQFLNNPEEYKKRNYSIVAKSQSLEIVKY